MFFRLFVTFLWSMILLCPGQVTAADLCDHGLRTIEMKVVVDPEVRRLAEWRTWVQSRVDFANRFFDDLDLSIRVSWPSKQMLVWAPMNAIDHPTDAMQFLKSNVDSDGVDIVVGFLGLTQPNGPKGINPAAASQNFRHVLAIDVESPEKVVYRRADNGELYVDHYVEKSEDDENREFVHELLHLFGLPHSPLETSIMHPSALGSGLEQSYIEAVRHVRCELDFDRGVQSLSAKRIEQLDSIFSNYSDGESMNPIAAGSFAMAVDFILRAQFVLAIPLLKQALIYEPDDARIEEALEVALSIKKGER